MAATIEGVDLPDQFQFGDFIPPKRYNLQETAQLVVFQEGCQPLLSSGLISFKCEKACLTEKCLILDIYQGNAPFTSSNLTLVGYNGQEYEVKMVSLNSTQVSANHWDLEGEFYVVSVTSDGCS